MYWYNLVTEIRILTIFLFQVFDRLQPLGICVSHSVASNVLGQIGGHFDAQLIDAVKAGKRFRIIGDNINFHVDTSHLRNSSKKEKHMEHWFGSAAIIQVNDFNYLSDKKPIESLLNISIFYLPIQTAAL